MSGSYKLETFEKDMPVCYFIEKYVRPEEFIEYCKVCGNYGKVWSCPPYDFDVMDYWQGYETIKCVAYKIEYEEQREISDYSEIAEVKEMMQKRLHSLENEYPGSVLLSAGSCSLCAEYAGADFVKGRRADWCTRIKGEPCARPDCMRYSIESIGGDVVAPLKDLFGLEIKWAEENMMPEYHILLGGLLMK